MKFKEPTKGKGMRTLFRRAGFQTYLVDEFNTSRMCSQCEVGICKKTIFRESPRPYRRKDILFSVHGLLRCKNKKCGCYWNRDVNGATNIYKIAYNAVNNKERPKYLQRSDPEALKGNPHTTTTYQVKNARSKSADFDDCFNFS